MPDFDEFLRRNRAFAGSDARARLTAMPDNRVFVVTCLDPRVEPSAFLGLTTGEAIVLRNPGGRLTDSTIADIALISFMGEFMGAEGPPLEVAVVHHSQCGMGLLANDAFRTGFAARTGFDIADLIARAVTDPRSTVANDVRLLLSSPLATPRITVSGHVLDLESGLLSTVVPASAPQVAPMESA